PLDVEDGLQPRGAIARLIDETTEDPSEPDWAHQSHEAVDALAPEAQPFDGRQGEGRLEEPGEKTNEAAAARATGQGGPHRGDQVEGADGRRRTGSATDEDGDRKNAAEEQRGTEHATSRRSHATHPIQ